MRRIPSWVIAAVVSAALLLPAGSAFAQKPQKESQPGAKGMQQRREKGGGKDGASQRAQFFEKLPDKLAEELELSDEQKTKVAAAVDKSKAKLETMQEEMKALQEKIRKEMFSMKEGIRENLTMDQKERFDMIIMKFMSRMMGGGMGREGMMGGHQGMDEKQGMMRKKKMLRMKMMQERGGEEEMEIEEGPEGGRMRPGGPDED
ncbi:MAG: hypothetical protein HZB91_05490 [Elusimicrobia bacterium]|nr:hypothetical protein [Elusimicrobiota bacterium]